VRRFRRNTSVAEMIERNPTVGLPLFEGPTKREQALLEAPRSIEVATGTRNHAYDNVTFDRKLLSRKQLDVMTALFALTEAYGDATNQEIADWIPRTINRITGRTFELREMDYVVLSQKRHCRSTGEIVQAWKTNPKLTTKPHPHPPLFQGEGTGGVEGPTVEEVNKMDGPPTMEEFE